MKGKMLDIFHSVRCHCTVMMGVTNSFIDNGGGFSMYVPVEGSEY